MTAAPRRRVSIPLFLSLLLATVPLLVVASYSALGIGRAQLRVAYGEQLGEVAERTAAGVDSYVFRAIMDVALLARVPDLQRAARDESMRPWAAEDARRIDVAWQRGIVPPPELGPFFESVASRFLRDISVNDPVYREIALTDRYGRLVASSGPTSDYLQSDEAWWIAAYGDGTAGAVEVGDVEWDESAQIFAVDIAVPVPGPDDDGVVGVLLVVADSRELFAAVRGAGDLQAQLIRRDGSLVFNQTGPAAASDRFFAEQLLREHLASVEPTSEPFRLSFSAATPDGVQRLVAIAPCQIGTSYPHLSWLIALSEPESRLFSPVAAQARNLLYALATTALVLLGLTIWFSLRPTMSGEIEGLDMHLVDHPKTPHLDEGDA